VVAKLAGLQLPAAAEASSDSDEESETEPATWQPPVGDAKLSDWTPKFADVRDDRVVLYGTLPRDVGMYDATLQARGKSGTLEIVKP
jgi:uncharacterized protein YfaS (alpha-2-macroglobulin family)